MLVTDKPYIRLSVNQNLVFMKVFTKKLALSLLISLACFVSFSQTSPISFTSIPFSDADFIYTPGRGAEKWHNSNEANIPFAGVSHPRNDAYRRFQWTQFEDATQDVYNWKDFDSAINKAIRDQQKFSFGIMTVYSEANEVEGHADIGSGFASYPNYLHTLMQSETNKDWRTDGSKPAPGCGTCMWVPNWNSNYYLNRWGALNRALAHHIATTSYNSVPYANVIQYVDIRGYGNYGEWHTSGFIDTVENSPAGTRITVASQKRIIDSVAAAFPNYPLVVMIAAFESYTTSFTNIRNDSAIAHYALTQSNAWGKFGWRKDSYGAEDAYLSTMMENNTAHFQGVRFDTAILHQYKYAPIVGERYGFTEMTVLPYQVRLYHTNSFGNGNYGIELSTGSKDSVRLASKLAGYRVVLDSGRIASTIVRGVSFPLTLYWKNVGQNPPYENWSAGFQVKNSSGTVVWTGNSTMVIKGFQPGTTASVTDNLTLPNNLAAGAYTLSLIIKDPNAYRQPMPLAITGRNEDGSYDLDTFSITAPVVPSSISFTNADLDYTPGRAAEQWHNANQVDIPANGVSSTRSDVYRRFQWSQFENATQGVYDWTDFDIDINEAIDSNQKFSFGIMTAFEGANEDDGYAEFGSGYASYPGYLHTLMQSETNKDWKTDGSNPDSSCTGCMWVPNWNSNYYLNRWGALNRALANHIATTSHNGVSYANVIQYVDIRGYGNYGSWHVAGILDDVDDSPTGTKVTVASQKRIIDSVAAAFPNYPLVVMIAALESGETFFSNIKNDPEIAHYALTQSNAWGKFGWRRDGYGSDESYYSSMLENNTASYSGVHFDTAILHRYKYAPIVGEPAFGIEMTGLPAQVRLYHVNSFGNGIFSELSPASEDSVRLASKLAGYRILIDSARITGNIMAGIPFQCILTWKNVGLNPPYENWSAGFQLKNSGGTVVWTASSSMVIKGFQPGTAASITDNLTLPGNLTAGNYTLSLIIKDPNAYRKPLPLAITGRNADGSYDLRSIQICTTPTATITAASTCNGSAFNLTLSAATGASPYDLVINGVTYNDKTVSSTITGFTPSTYKIWSANPSLSGGEDNPVELGVKFSSSVGGYIKGIRFHSPASPSGTYTARLYDDGGTLLASQNFSSVTSNAWQEVEFSTPVAITANTAYMAMYYSADGNYGSTNSGLSTAIFNGPLMVPEGGGVYQYPGNPGFHFNENNYWADVLFVADAYSIRLTGITDNNGCTATGILQTLNVASEACEEERRMNPNPQATANPNAWKYALHQSYPNPAHDQARIMYTIPENTAVSLFMFNVHGQLIKVLANGVKAKGSHTVDVNTSSLAKGVYYYTMRTKEFTATRKMIIQ
jgi:Domain of unknown function (DUF4082)/Domain of unknown function (DUF4832)/Secretion system C-terminal sorting domain